MIARRRARRDRHRPGGGIERDTRVARRDEGQRHRRQTRRRAAERIVRDDVCDGRGGLKRRGVIVHRVDDERRPHGEGNLRRVAIERVSPFTDPIRQRVVAGRRRGRDAHCAAGGIERDAGVGRRHERQRHVSARGRCAAERVVGEHVRDRSAGERGRQRRRRAVVHRIDERRRTRRDDGRIGHDGHARRPGSSRDELLHEAGGRIDQRERVEARNRGVDGGAVPRDGDSGRFVLQRPVAAAGAEVDPTRDRIGRGVDRGDPGGGKERRAVAGIDPEIGDGRVGAAAVRRERDRTRQREEIDGLNDGVGARIDDRDPAGCAERVEHRMGVVVGVDRHERAPAVRRDGHVDGEIEDVRHRGRLGGERGDHGIGRRVDHRHFSRCDVNPRSVWCYGDGSVRAADRHRCDDRIAARVDHVDDAGGVQDVDASSARVDGDARGLVADRDRGDDVLDRRIDGRDRVGPRVGHVDAAGGRRDRHVRRRDADVDRRRHGVGGRVDDGDGIPR